MTFALSPGEAHDAPNGRALLSSLGKPAWSMHLVMDKAYEGEQKRQLALDLGFTPVVAPKSSRIEPWEYDREMYKRRNEIERLFRRLKGVRPHLPSLREAGCPVPRIPDLRLDRRGAT